MRLFVVLLLLTAACSAEEPLASTTTIGEDQTTTSSLQPTTTSTVATTTTSAPTTTTSTLTVEIPDAVGVVTVIDGHPAATGGVAADSLGNVYFSDMGPAPARLGNRIFKLSPDGKVTLHARSDQIRGASGLAIDEDGTIYQSSFSSGAVFKVSPEGDVEEFANDGIVGPIGVVLAPEGGLYVADCRGGRVLSVDSGGAVEVISSDPILSCPNGLALADDGNLYVANFGDSRVVRVSLTGETEELIRLPGGNLGHITFHDGALYVATRGASQIHRVTLEGEPTPVVGTGEMGTTDGPPLEAQIDRPNGIAFTPDGALWFNQPQRPVSANNPISLRRVVFEP